MPSIVACLSPAHNRRLLVDPGREVLGDGRTGGRRRRAVAGLVDRARRWPPDDLVDVGQVLARGDRGGNQPCERAQRRAVLGCVAHPGRARDMLDRSVREHHAEAQMQIAAVGLN
ncbi:MAG: hypothetical protein ABSA52_14480 [Candidatus Binatia bacterium]